MTCVARELWQVAASGTELNGVRFQRCKARRLCLSALNYGFGQPQADSRFTCRCRRYLIHAWFAADPGLGRVIGL